MEPNVAPTLGSPAVYGRACSACARAKAKCVTGNGIGAKCQRCLRLNKDCQPLETVRKRRTASRPSAARTERLEKKLDGLYKFLQSSTPSTFTAGENTTVPTTPTSIQPSPESLQSLAASPKGGEDFDPRAIQRIDWCHRPIDGLRLHSPTTSQDSSYVISGTRSTIHYSPESPFISDLEPSAVEAEECLAMFRTQMASHFPFILIPEATTAYELHRDRPFLWTCIMSISSKSSAQQLALGKEARITMGREILVEGKNNIDLLLGVLVFIAWGQYHVFDRPILKTVTQLAMALVTNLGLNKSPLKEPSQMLLNLDAQGCPIKPFSPSIRTTEERRAVLGYFVFSSVVSSYFQRAEALGWTPYLDECVTVLAEGKEYPSDALLIQLVKLQLIAEKVAQAPWNDGLGDATGSARAPLTFYLKALQAQLQNFQAQIPPEMQKSDVLLLHQYSTELRVHEIALSKAAVVSNSPGFQHLECLYACLHATKSWFDVFLSFPPARYVVLSMATFTQLAHCIIALFRLLTFDDTVWDRALVRDTANLSSILEQIIENCNQVKVVAGLDRGVLEVEDVFSTTARTLGPLKTWWDAKLAAESSDNVAIDETFGGTTTDILDEAWLKDILGQGDGQFDPNMQW